MPTFKRSDPCSLEFASICKALQALASLTVERTERESTVGNWPFESLVTELDLVYKMEGQTAVTASLLQDRCDGAMEDEESYEITVAEDQPELIELIEEIRSKRKD